MMITKYNKIQEFYTTSNRKFNVNETSRMCFESKDNLVLEIDSAFKPVTHWNRDQRKSFSCSHSSF